MARLRPVKNVTKNFLAVVEPLLAFNLSSLNTKPKQTELGFVKVVDKQDALENEVAILAAVDNSPFNQIATCGYIQRNLKREFGKAQSNATVLRYVHKVATCKKKDLKE